MRMRSGNRGVILIVVLGVLVVLALLATTFASLQAIDRSITRNYLDMVRAKLLAQSGIEDAAARLSDPRFLDPQTSGPQAWKFWGLDPTETVEPDVALQGPDALRLERAVNPSFALEDESPQNPNDASVRPKTLMVDGRPSGVSGFHESTTYARHGDYYALKINDLSGRIHVNDGVDGPPNNSVTQNLKRILNVLGQVTTVNVPGLGDRIIINRPPTGYQTSDELLKAVDNDPVVFARFKNYVTVRAWVDKNVCNPVPLSAAMLPRYPITYYRGTPEVYRLGVSKNATGADLPEPKFYYEGAPFAPTSTDIAIYGLDVLNPLGIEIVSRAPVCVNSAPKEVLIALLTGLKGFFVSDRRRNQPSFEMSFMPIYAWQNNYGPGNISRDYATNKDSNKSEGDEMGFLYETYPIIGPGSTGSGLSAIYLAEEILACRNRARSPHGTSGGPGAELDYGAPSCWFGGPFRTWRQFNAFVDNLIRIAVIDDPRNIYFDHSVSPLGNELDQLGGRGYGGGATVPSTYQRDHARQAIASVIKANFNPNLHLNETNPDENLYQIVDKTDLVVNSTEFCFLPTGHFEVESLGRVLRTVSGTDCLTAANNQIVAQAKVSAIYRFYNVYRETSQAQFSKGTLKNASHRVGTNNGMTLEVGPEPDNGTAPRENEWGGYVALPTVGSIYHEPTPGNSGTPLSTPAGSSPFSVDPDYAFHGHFTRDFDLHDSGLEAMSDIARRELASMDTPNSLYDDITNIADRLPNGGITGYPGPYGPGPTSGGGNVHRLARSFRQTPGSTQSPFPAVYAPSDLRVDGGYSERNCGFAYALHWPGLSLWDFDAQYPSQGTIDFWFKPAFQPELTGKVRTIWDLSRYHAPCDKIVYPIQAGCFVFPYSLWYVPAHHPSGESMDPGSNPPYPPFYPPRYTYTVERGFFHFPNEPGYFQYYNPPLYANYPSVLGVPNLEEVQGQFRPSSLLWGTESPHGLGIYQEPTNGVYYGRVYGFGRSTDSLNHIGHTDDQVGGMSRAQQNLLRAHRWIHVGFTWNLVMDAAHSAVESGQVYLNGVRIGNPSERASRNQAMIKYLNRHDQATDPPPTFIAAQGCYDDPSGGSYNQMRFGAPSSYMRNVPFTPHLGNHSADATIDEIYGWIVEDPIKCSTLWSYGRYFNPKSVGNEPDDALFTSQAFSIAASADARVLAPPSAVGNPPPGTTTTMTASTLRILGASWTWYADDVNATNGNPVLYDYSGGAWTIQPRTPQVMLGFEVGTTKYGPFSGDRDRFCEVVDSFGNPLVVQDASQLHYTFLFRISDATPSSMFLGTPVLDDVTIYWSDGPKVLSYVFETRAL